VPVKIIDHLRLQIERFRVPEQEKLSP
jgi:hypothetical protein